MSATLEDWQPGDGLVCTYSKRSPIACGRPIKTAVSVQSGGPRLPDRTVRRPLCEHHAAARVTGVTVGAARALGERNAYQRLAHAHWDEFLRYSEEETAKVMGAPSSSESDAEVTP